MESVLELLQDADPFKTWWPAIAAIVFGIAITVRTIMSGQRCPNDNQIRDLIVIVTGANRGIGFEIAKALAGRRGRIILACRNMQLAEKAAAIIKRELGCRVIEKQPQKAIKSSGSLNTTTAATSTSITTDADVHSHENMPTTSSSSTSSTSSTSCDTAAIATATNSNSSLSKGGTATWHSNRSIIFVEARYLELRSFDCVHQFARNVMAEFERVDVLINNAGIIFAPTKTNTVDGFEHHLQVNYLSPFLLTHLLLPHLRKSENGRIINVSAHGHAAAKMDLDDPLNVGTWAIRFQPRDAFSHSKLAIILATRWLAVELKDTAITVNCLTPGLVRGTSHLRSSPLMSAICVKFITFPWMWLFMKTPSEGAQCAIRLATDPTLKHVTGEYFNDCEIAVTSPLGQDKELAKKLYYQTIEALKDVTKLEVDKEKVENEYDSDAKEEEGESGSSGGGEDIIVAEDSSSSDTASLAEEKESASATLLAQKQLNGEE